MPALALIIALTAARAGAPPDSAPRPAAHVRGDALVLTRGAGPGLALRPVLLVDHRPRGGAGTPRPTRLSLARWRRATRPATRWCFASRATTPTLRFDLVVCALARDPRIRLDMTATYLKRTWPRLEALELTLPAATARYLGRDLRLTALPRRGAHVDRWTPLLVTGQRADGLRWALRGGPRLDGGWLRPHKGGAVVRLELDDVRNHPVKVHRGCVAKWRPRLPLVDRSAGRRSRGQSVVRRAWMHLDRQPRTPLWIHRWPGGRLAAVTFTGHADQAQVRATRAVAWGAGHRRHRRFGKGGFLGHGLPYTMTFFWGGARFYQPAQHQAFLALVKEMRRRGCDIGLHSATPKRDDRRTTEGGLQWFAGQGARTWIDHSPATNCEAWANQGWNPRSPWYIGDLLHKHGIRYLWAGRDARHLPWRSLNLLAPQAPHRRRYLLFQHDQGARGAPRGFWLWYSQWTYEKRWLAVRRWAPKRLDQLQAERGVHVAHVYLDALHPPRHSLYPRNHLTRDRDGTPLVHPQFDRVLAELARRQRRGDLWVTTLPAIADHLIATRKLELRLRDDQAVVVTNRGRAPVKGLTLTVAAVGVTVRVSGGAPTGTRRGATRTDFWFDLPGGATRVIRIRRAGRSLRLLP